MEKASLNDRINNMDGMSEVELEKLLKEYKRTEFPHWRKALLFTYHVGMFGLLAYYTINCKRLNKKLFNIGNNYTKLNIFKIGTIQSVF